MDWTLDQIEALATLATDKGLAEITLTDGDKTITIKTPASVAQTVIAGAPAPAMAGYAPAPAVAQAPPAPKAAASPAPAATPASYQTVTAPMVGTFYRSSSPESPPFAEVGQRVTVGQSLCILEAMKQMNTLESELTGVVKQVLVDNGQPVEYGQPLFVIDTAG
jgi:acetyl-CoA carboxylase biotin carboxyl carrier protein